MQRMTAEEMIRSIIDYGIFGAGADAIHQLERELKERERMHASNVAYLTTKCEEARRTETGDSIGDMLEDEHGEYVLYEDHAKFASYREVMHASNVAYLTTKVEEARGHSIAHPTNVFDVTCLECIAEGDKPMRDTPRTDSIRLDPDPWIAKEQAMAWARELELELADARAFLLAAQEMERKIRKP
jgi:hypothetical protein